MENSFKARIDAQYYTDREVKEETVNLMILEAPKFFVRCKAILNGLASKEVKTVREKLKKS